MVAKNVQPRFLLGPDTKVLTMNPEQTKDPKAQKEKMNMFRRHLAANRARSDDAIRRKMELLKEQRSLSSVTKTHIQRDMEAEAKARMEEELGRPVSSKEWPFVYFVVTLDQFPQLADDSNPELSSRSLQTARERQRFLTSRRKKIQEAREENEKIREANIDMGLRLEPIKPSPQPPAERVPIQRLRTRPSLTKHPTTPASSVGSKAEFPFLNTQDDLSDVEITRRSIGMIINDTLSQVGGALKTAQQCPVSNVELPEISSSAKRKNLGTTQPALAPKGGLGERKMVTFAEGLPVIKGNGIPVLGVKNVDVVSSSSPSFPPSHTKSAADAARNSALLASGGTETEQAVEDFLRPPWSAPLTNRSLNSMGSKSKMYEPMALPRIDIVSEIYDELIVKTIQNYLMAEGYSQDKYQQLRQTVLARLSATYPHLVRHKAWQPDHSVGEEPDTPGTGREAAGATQREDDLVKPQTRGKTFHSRHGRTFAERGLSSFEYSHNLRPFTCPYFTVTPEYRPPPSLMSIDGRTMTITPRDDPRHRPTIGVSASSLTPFSPLWQKSAIYKEEEEGEEGEEGNTVVKDNEEEVVKRVPPKPFVIPSVEEGQ